MFRLYYVHEKHDRLPDFSKLCAPEQTPISFFLSQQIYFFFLGSIGGFLWEVAIFLYRDKTFANRGFLYGPWLPVYGIGAVLFYLLLGCRRKKSTRPASFPQCCHRHRSGTPDRMVSGYLLGPALLGLQRLSFSFSWLYLPVRGGRLRHRGRALDLCAGGAAHQAVETTHPQSAPWIKHPASVALCRGLRGCAHFPNHGAGITFP